MLVYSMSTQVLQEWAFALNTVPLSHGSRGGRGNEEVEKSCDILQQPLQGVVKQKQSQQAAVLCYCAANLACM